MKKMVISTGNAGKVREFKEILQGWQVTSMKEEGVAVSVEENGTTFAANARIKAQALAQELKNRGIAAIAIADDSGLEIDAFDGAPGVYSARYLGEDTPYDIKNGIILDQMKEYPVNRGARYACAVVAVLPDESVVEAYATVEGSIAWEPAGEGGFGYDPIFFVPEYNKTMAQLTPDEKNAISHRGKALEIIKQLLDNR
ncbi:MAG: RdgB/HAM1 family non-canonical purine NTP pyrophosphatase [Firmicutes bacterium]|nr:RdgB/HAM1 family non-canonical purine NTP pyrophosphatase [Bacillota bacterium]